MITFSTLSIAADATLGTLVTVLAMRGPGGAPVPCTYSLAAPSAWFAIVGDALISDWAMSDGNLPAPGNQTVHIEARRADGSLAGAVAVVVDVQPAMQLQLFAMTPDGVGIVAGDPVT